MKMTAGLRGTGQEGSSLVDDTRLTGLWWAVDRVHWERFRAEEPWAIYSAHCGGAVKVSPQNAPLRRHLGESLLKAGLLEEAEQELRIVVQMRPDDEGAALMLATVFLRCAKAAQAIVIVEDWARRGASSAMLVL